MSNKSQSQSVLTEMTFDAQPRRIGGRSISFNRETLTLKEPIEANQSSPSMTEKILETEKKRAYADAFEIGKKDGYEVGLAEGRVAGSKESFDLAEARSKEQIRKLEQLSKSFSSAFTERLDALETDALELSFQVICKIFGELASSKIGCEGLLNEAFQRMRDQPIASVKMHPYDIALIEQEGAENSDLSEMISREKIQFIPDAQIALGGCILEGGGGTLDARIETQLLQLKRALQAVRNEKNDY